jgi:hypothetical protein
MWTYQKALSVIRAYVAAATDGLALVLEDETIDRPYGWVFFYQSREYVETGDARTMLFGNAPLIFNRASGEIRVTGTALPAEEYLRQYEAGLSPIELAMTPERHTRKSAG